MREASNWQVADKANLAETQARLKVINQGLLIDNLQIALARKNRYAASLESQVRTWRNWCTICAGMALLAYGALYLVTQ